MAKAKNKGLTVEDALVPVDEQPYELPNNWTWIKWGSAGEFVAGNGFKNNYQGFTEFEIPFYKVGSLKHSDSVGYLYDESNTINEDMRSELKATLIPVDSVLFAKIGEAIRLNRRSLNRVPCCIDNNMMAFIASTCSYKYAFYWSKGLELYDYAKATTVPAIRKSVLENIPFPLAPAEEQQRIVEQIENLFSKLDEAKEKTQIALDNVADRKLAILNDAYSGKFTTDWRGDKEISTERLSFADICTKITDGFHNSPKSVEEGYPYVMAGSVKETGIDYYNGLFMDEKNHRELYNKAYPEKGDILMVNIGAGSGTAAVIDVDFEFSFKNSAILKLKKDVVNPYYVLYYIWLKKKYLLIEVTRGGAQPFLSLKIINGIEIPVCKMEEQNEIVSIIQKLLDNENAVQEKLEKVLETIEVLKKSILAKAFRGELGTNNPEEENSIELLRKIIEK